MSQTLKILFLDFSASTFLKLTYVYTKIKKKQQQQHMVLLYLLKNSGKFNKVHRLLTNKKSYNEIVFVLSIIYQC